MKVVLDTQAEQQYFKEGALYTSTRYLRNTEIVGEVICASGSVSDFAEIIRMANAYISVFPSLEWIGFATEQKSGVIRISKAEWESEQETAQRFDAVAAELPQFLREWWATENLRG
jgi:hypothetical protein